MNRALVLALALAACKSQEPAPAPPDPWAQPAKVRVSAPPPARSAAMTPEEAKATIDEALRLAKQPKRDCDQIANKLAVALPVIAPSADAGTAPAYRTLQKCALDTKRWRAAVRAGIALLDQKPDTFELAQIVRALAEMGHYDKALAAAKELTAKFPAAAKAIRSAAVYVHCRAEQWDVCEREATAELADLETANANPRDRDVVVAHVLRDFAWIVRAKPKQAVEDVEALEKLGNLPDRTTDAFTTVKTEGTRAAQRGYYLEVVPSASLATGVYHLMGRKDTGALVTLKLAEHTGTARQFRVDAEVPGITEHSSNSLELGPHQFTIKFVNPPLKIDFDPTKVRAPRPTQLALKIVDVTGGVERSVVDETIPLQLLPRDYLPLARKTGADSVLPTYGFVGAWVTPNERIVDDFLAKAKQRLDRHAFTGEEDATVPQVKAMFDELEARGVTYVMDPEVTSAAAYVQRTRLPADVLATTNAQCLEGSLVFATLMEAVGIKPILVIVPGHAFVGWHTGARDGANGEPMFVETTMVGSHDFDQAVKVATHRFEQETKAGAFKTGAATMIDIAEIRQQGYTAQPL